MDLIEELLEAASKTDMDAQVKRQASLEQHFLNIRAQAAMAGLADMDYMVESQKKLESSK